MALASAGDATSFERLYRGHVARVHGLARRMLGSAEEADEVTQDVFVRAWSKLGTFRGESQFGTWLHRLAVNLILAHRSRRSTERARWLDDAEAVDLTPARHAPAGLRQDLEAAMARLPGGARRVFVLHDVEGYRHEEIADRLGISTGTSKSQLHRARMALRGLLER